MDVFKIVGKFMLDGKEQFDSDIDGAKKKGNDLSVSVGKGLEAVGKVGIAAAKVCVTAVAAASAAIGALMKESIEGFAEFEQLEGGARLLWGEAFDFVAEKSSQAYATVQLSTNDYLRQMNTLSTGLITSLKGDEQAAAELADRIITAQADIVAATGASRDSVENAFNGIMKSNFSMLDNLQLGITPTKEGFQDLIKQVNAYNKTLGKTTNYQIDNLADCQAALLDYIEMQGLSGYASAEAAETIEGSLAMMKASWQNLVVGMANSDADVESLVDNFVKSAGTAADKILPRLSTAMNGIGKFVEGLAPVIAEALPKLVTDLLPSLVKAAVNLLQSFGMALFVNAPVMVQSILDTIFMLLVDGLGMSDDVAERIVGIFEKVFSAVIPILESLWEVVQVVFWALGEAAESLGITWDDVFSGIELIIEGLVLVIQLVAEQIVKWVTWLVEEAQTEGTFLNEVFLGIQGVVEALWELCVLAFEGIAEAFAELAEAAQTDGTIINEVWLLMQECAETVWPIIESVVLTTLKVIENSIRQFTAVMNGDWTTAWDIFLETVTLIGEETKKNVEELVEYIANFYSKMFEIGYELIVQLGDGIAAAFAEMFPEASEWIEDNIISPMSDKGNDMYEAGKNMLNSWWNGAKSLLPTIESWWENWQLTPKDVPGTGSGEEGTPHKTGLDYVPYDEYPAILHKGEAVLTATEAAVWRAGQASNENTDSEPQQRTSSHSGITIVQNIQTVPQTPVEFAAATEAYFEQARWSFA